MKTPTIIAFTGKKQSGKTTASQYLVNKRRFTPINFKDALYAEVKQFYPGLLNEMLIYEFTGTPYTTDGINSLFQYKPPLMRRLLQDHRQMRREEDKDYWCEIWHTKVMRLMDNNKHPRIVVDDVRHINEAGFVRGFGGIIIRIINPNLKYKKDNHISETEMNKIKPDYVIINDGTIKDLHRKIKELINKKDEDYNQGL